MTKPVIVTRAGKGSALTWTEGDSNFTNLQNATLTVTDGTNSKALDLNSTLTFTAGTNVTLSVNSSTGAVTINSSQPTSVATLTTPRAIYGNNFDGSAALTQIIASTYGGTGNGFTKFSGPTTAERIFTLPDASSTILVSGGALGTPSSGTVTNLTGTASININGTVGATTATSGAFTTVSASGVITSTQATGTAPFIVASTTNVANLNASSLNGATFAAPGAIGSGTASAGTFSALTATGTTTLATSLTGLLKAASGVVSTATAGTDYVAINGVLGTPSSGTVTNLTGTASININGTVGATTPTTGAFTSISSSTNTTIKDLRETIATVTYAATITPDVANGTVQKVTLTGNVTFSAFANPVTGQSLTLFVIQDGTGSRLLTSTMKFSGASKTLSTAASSVDIMTIFYDGTNYYASLAKGFA
jgi:hypothetical protein